MATTDKLAVEPISVTPQFVNSEQTQFLNQIQIKSEFESSSNQFQHLNQSGNQFLSLISPWAETSLPISFFSFPQLAHFFFFSFPRSPPKSSTGPARPACGRSPFPPGPPAHTS